MKIRDEKGFTLVEVIVVAGIIAILAGILVPMILKEIDESKVTRATADVRSIFAAMLVMKKDTGQWPIMDAGCNPNGTLLVGAGNQPANLAAMGYDTSVSSSFDDHLSSDVNGCYNNWKGTYMVAVTADPWGNSYISNVGAFLVAGSPEWIISAGPNGQIETPSFMTTLFGDDIGIRMQ